MSVAKSHGFVCYMFLLLFSGVSGRFFTLPKEKRVASKDNAFDMFLPIKVCSFGRGSLDLGSGQSQPPVTALLGNATSLGGSNCSC